MIIKFQPWSGNIAYETEATTSEGRFLSLYAAPLPACPWDRWVYTVDTHIEAGIHELRPLAVNITYRKETAFAAAEADARHWLRRPPRLEAIS